MTKKQEKTIISFFLACCAGAFLFNLSQSYYLQRQRRKKWLQELIFWKKIVSQHPEYPDGWAKLALIWDQLQRPRLARLAIGRARQLDPIRPEFRQLEKSL